MANQFSNDGSFLAQFMQKQPPAPQQQPHHQQQQQTQQPQSHAPYAQYGAPPPQMGYGQPAPYGAMAAAPYGAPPPYSQGYPGYDNRMPPPMQSQSSSRGQPSCSIWLGGIHPDTNESEIRVEFARFGMIDTIKILPHKNCAFVNFRDLQDALTAHEAATRSNLAIRGQELRIGWGKTENKPMMPQPGDKFQPCKNLWVGNLSEEVTEDDLRSKFTGFGHIENIRVLPHKNCAFVNFTNVNDALAARNAIQSQILYGRPLRINFGRDDAKPRDSNNFEQQNQAPAIPQYAPPPPDPALKNRIDSLIEFVCKNGRGFEEFMKRKEEDNSKFSFLFTGPEHMYYKWKVYCAKTNTPDQPPPGYCPPQYGAVPPPNMHMPHQQQQQQQQHQPPHMRPPPPQAMPPTPGSVPFSAQQHNEFKELLEKLSGTKQSIQQGKDWLLNNKDSAQAIAIGFVHRMQELNDFEKKLHLIYLINDALVHSAKTRSAPSIMDDPLSIGIHMHIVAILHPAYQDKSQDHEKILKILKLWEKRHIFNTEQVRDMEQGIKRPQPPQLQQQQQQQHHHQNQPPWSNRPTDSYGGAPMGQMAQAMDEFYGAGDKRPRNNDRDDRHDYARRKINH